MAASKKTVCGWLGLGSVAFVMGAAGDCYRNPDLGVWKLAAAVAGVGCFAQAIAEADAAEQLELQALAVLEDEQQLDSDRRQLQRMKLLAMDKQTAEAELQVHQVLAEGKAEQMFYRETGIQPGQYTAAIEPPAQPLPAQTAPMQPVEAVAPLNDAVVAPVASNVVTPPQWAAKPVAMQPATPKAFSCPMLDEIVSSKRSTVAAAPSGTGKSVSRAYVLSQFNQKFPDGEVYVISQKNDSFQGLREAGRLKVFDIMNPAAAFEQLRTVFDVFDTRRKALEGDRAAFDSKPVRLLIDDWHSIYDSIKGTEFYKKELKQLLSTIVTVGREMNVCLWIDTQSYNLASLGLAEDANIRLSLNITCQGYSFVDAEGMLQGDYAMISNLLNNRYLISEGGEALKAQYEQLKAQSQAQKTPVIFTSVGRPRLALLPDLRAYKPGLIQAAQQPPQVGTTGDIYDMVNAVKAGAA